MAGVSSLGIGSGLDLQKLMTNLVSAERAPLALLDKKEASYQSSISAVGALKGALSSFQSSATNISADSNSAALAKFSSFQASIADSAVASVSAGTGAVAGTYNLEVSSLASGRQQKLSTSYAPGVAALDFNGQASASLTLTKGTGANQSTVTITLNSAQNTLTDLRDAINKAGAGVSALIVTGADGKQNFLLNSTDSGTENAVTVGGTLQALDGTGTPTSLSSLMSTVKEATDAAATINGIAVKTSGNTLSNAIDGLTITLKQTTINATTGVSTPTAITVSQDNASLQKNLNAFIKSYNDLNATMTNLSKYDSKTKTASALTGDAMLRNTQSQIRSTVLTSANELGSNPVFKSLMDIGVSIDKQGVMSLDSKKFSAAMAKNPDAVATVVSTYGNKVQDVTEKLLDGKGQIEGKLSSLNKTVSDISKQRAAVNTRISNVTKMYQTQFSALDTSLAKMQSTGNYLAQQLSAISNFTYN